MMVKWYLAQNQQLQRSLSEKEGMWVKSPGGGGYSHTLPIRVCAAQRGRDFEAPDLERGIHFRGAVSRTGYKKLWITALSSA